MAQHKLFEYLVVKSADVREGSVDPDSKLQAIQSQFNLLGLDGWLLTNTFLYPSQGFVIPSIIVCVFSREIL